MKRRSFLLLSIANDDAGKMPAFHLAIPFRYCIAVGLIVFVFFDLKMQGGLIALHILLVLFYGACLGGFLGAVC